MNIYDALTRHQIHLEQVKLGARRMILPTLAKIGQRVRDAVAALGVNSLGELTRVQFNMLFALLVRQSGALLARYQRELMTWLKKLMHVELTHMRQLMEEFFDEPDKAKRRGLVWASIANAIIPGAGTTLAGMITNFAAAVTAQISKRVAQAYANKLSVADAVNSIVGTTALNRKDGYLTTSGNISTSVTNTAIQMVSVASQTYVQQLYVDRYQYVAVIDDRTSEICEELDGQIFVYGQGPVPPQHLNCRSKTIPLTNDDTQGYPAQDFSDWLDEQPEDVQTEVERTGAFQ